MLTPTIEFAVGILIALYLYIARRDGLTPRMPCSLRPDSSLWIAGWATTSLTLVLGLVGSLFKLDLALPRMFLGLLSLSLLGVLALARLLSTRRVPQLSNDRFFAIVVDETRWVSGTKLAVSAGVVLVVTTEALSLLRLLTPGTVTAGWLAGTAVAGMHFWRRRHTIQITTVPIGAIDRALLAIVVLLVGLLGLVAVLVPPNTWDSMVYHIPRVAHWTQQASVAHYQTTIPRQTFQPPGASFAVLHLYLLARGDRLANLVQWASMVVSLLGVSAITAFLGGSVRARVLAVVVAATIPIGVLQATTTQNDYVEAVWLVSLAVLILARQSPVFIGLALGLALLTKGTGYPFAAPLIAWWCVDAISSQRLRAVRGIAVVALLAVMLNSGHYARNIAWYGAPLGPGRDGPFVYANERHDLLPVLSVVVRNLAVHAATPWPSVNAWMTRLVERTHVRVGVDANDPLTTWHETQFAVAPLRFNEDLASNGAHLVLVMFSFALAIVQRRGKVATYALLVTAGFLAFSDLFRWQPWHTRLELPLFVLAAPVVGLVLQGRQLIGPLLGAALVAMAILTIVYNESRPLLGPQSVFIQDRTAQLFANRRHLEGAYRASATRLRDLGCRRIEVWSAGDGAEYPLWVLTGAPWNGIEIEHFNAERPAANACALFIVPVQEAPVSLPVAGVPYRREVWDSSVALYVREPR
jgi:hypothetical protein